MQFKPTIVTPSSVAIIEIADAKRHLRIDWSDDDQDITRMIVAIKKEIEEYLGRFLIDTELLQKYPAWNGGLHLPYSPVISIESVKYFDANNVETTWAPSNYQFAEIEDEGIVCTATGVSFPSVYSRIDPISVQFKCGYGVGATHVPADIIDAGYIMLSERFNDRGASLETCVVAERLLKKHRHFK